MPPTRSSLSARRNPDRTKGRLLRAAIRLFARRGYDGVAVDEVVAAARVNKRMVYHYYGSKEDLYLAALAEVFGQLQAVEFEALDVALTPEIQLRRLIGSYFDFLDNHPEFVRLLLWENLEQGHHIARQPGSLSKNPFFVRLTAVIDHGVERGVFRPPVDRRHLAANLIGLCFIYYSNRYSLRASLGLTVETALARRRRLDQVLDLVFHGVLARERPKKQPPP